MTGSRPVVLIVTGSRYLSDPSPVRAVLSEYLGRDVVLYHGDNPGGADSHAHAFAEESGWRIRRHPARWRAYDDLSAGKIRNGQMVAAAVREARSLRCDVVCLAFPGPSSTGTPDCMRKARLYGVSVRRFPVPE